MYTGCFSKRHWLANNQRNEATSYHASSARKRRPHNFISSYDERFHQRLFETNIVRWMLGICCLFLLFPGIKNKLCKYVNNIFLITLDYIINFVIKLFSPEAMGRTPKFIGHLQNVTVSQGREATFTCTVTHLGGHRVSKF